MLKNLYLVTNETFEMEFFTNFHDVVMIEILSKLPAVSHSLKVEESNPSVETLQSPGISVLSPGVFFPVLVENCSVVRGHVLSQAKQLAGIKLIKLLVQAVEALLELYVGVDHDELLEGEDEVIKW